MCFEVLGFDVFLDENLQPWILEVNHTPSFTTDSPLDFKVKKCLISDTIKLLNLNYYKKMKIKRQKAQELQKRAVKGKIVLTREEKEALKEKHEQKRHRIEAKIEHNFELLYPSEIFSKENYSKYIEASVEIYNEQTGKKKNVSVEEEGKKAPPKFAKPPKTQLVKRSKTLPQQIPSAKS